MALTRKFLKALGVEDDKAEQIIEEHTTIANRMNAEIDKYKADAEKLAAVQKELDELKAAGDDGFKEKYEAEKKAFADYKTEIAAKETKAAKEKAVRSYFESKNIEGANLNIAMRSSGAEIDAVELEDGKIKDTVEGGCVRSAVFTGESAAIRQRKPPDSTERRLRRGARSAILSAYKKRAARARNGG